MIPAIPFLTKPLGQAVMIAVFVTIVLGVYYYQSNRIEKLASEKAVLETDLKNAKDIIKQKSDQMDLINKQRDAITALDEAVKERENSVTNKLESSNSKRVMIKAKEEHPDLLLKIINKATDCEIKNFNKNGICKNGVYYE